MMTGSEWNSFLPIVITGLGVAALHSSLPTHWMPFVSASRAHGWSQLKTLGVTALAGAGHVLFTALLGALIVWFGVEIDERIGGWFHLVAATILIAVGAYYILSHLKRDPENHQNCCGKRTDRMTIAGLFLALTFSPCEAFLPVYLSGVEFGLHGYVLLSFSLLVGTAVGMTGLSWLALKGIRHLRLNSFERYESLILGLLLCLLGLGTGFLH